MRAVVLKEYGGPEVLTIDEVPDPVPGPEEVVVDIAATAVNRADTLQRMGLYPGPPSDAEIPGLEFAGRVSALGTHATQWAIGDEVMAITGGGAYAEQIAIHERQLMAVPESVGLPNAGAIPEVWITAWDALVLQGGLRPGGRALVHAGASGVGTAAIQIAHLVGAEIAVTVSSGKVEAVKALGANRVIDYTAQDFQAEVKDWTGGEGVDVVLDVIGGDYLEKNLRSIRVGGTIVQVGVMGGGRTEISLGLMLPKRATIVGTVLRPRPLEEKIAVSRKFAAEVLPFFDAGMARPVLDTTFPIDRISEAHERMEANANVGKILVTVAP